MKIMKQPANPWHCSILEHFQHFPTHCSTNYIPLFAWLPVSSVCFFALHSLREAATGCASEHDQKNQQKKDGAVVVNFHYFHCKLGMRTCRRKAAEIKSRLRRRWPQGVQVGSGSGLVMVVVLPVIWMLTLKPAPTATTSVVALLVSASDTTSTAACVLVVEVRMSLVVHDAAAINENTAWMIEGFADVMGMAASQVILEFQVPRPLSTGRLQVQLPEIFFVIFVEVPSVFFGNTALDWKFCQDSRSAGSGPPAKKRRHRVLLLRSQDVLLLSMFFFPLKAAAAWCISTLTRASATPSSLDWSSAANCPTALWGDPATLCNVEKVEGPRNPWATWIGWLPANFHTLQSRGPPHSATDFTSHNSISPQQRWTAILAAWRWHGSISPISPHQSSAKICYRQ